MRIKLTLLFIFQLLYISSYAQSKKEILEKYEKIQKTNLSLEKSNAVLEEKVKSLTERVKRLENRLKAAESSAEKALAEKNQAINALDKAKASEIEALKAKEVLLKENNRLELVFNREMKEKPKLRQLSVVGRYHPEKSEAKQSEYIDLFEDGTVLLVDKTDKKAIVKSISGTYKLKGNKITIIANLFTMNHVIEGTIEGNQLIITENGKKRILNRE